MGAMENGLVPGRTLPELQAVVDAWIRAKGRYWTPLSQYARLAEELGELGRELNHRFGDKPRAPKDGVGSIAEELGDVLFVVIALANSLDIDLDATLRGTLRKYEARPAAPEPSTGAAASLPGAAGPDR